LDILAVNAGSSSLKLRLVRPDGSVSSEADLAPDQGSALERFLARSSPPEAAAHRFVHGGRLDQAVLLTDDVLREIEAAGELAPLQPLPRWPARASSRG
jgi:acetate kinase